MPEKSEITTISDPEAIPTGSILFVGSYFRKGVYHAMPVVWGEVTCEALGTSIDVREKGRMGRGFYKILDKVSYRGDR